MVTSFRKSSLRVKRQTIRIKSKNRIFFELMSKSFKTLKVCEEKINRSVLNFFDFFLQSTVNMSVYFEIFKNSIKWVVSESLNFNGFDILFTIELYFGWEKVVWKIYEHDISTIRNTDIIQFIQITYLYMSPVYVKYTVYYIRHIF